MNVNQTVDAIVHAYSSRQPLFLWGAPGVGKSSAGKQARQKLAVMLKNPKFGLLDLRISLLDPVDLRGMPFPVKDIVKWLRPAFFPTGGAGIIILDEFVQAPISMQNAASQLVLDRRIGEYELPEGWMVMAAGNRLADRAGTNSMPTHIANRFIHLNVEVDPASWTAWALDADIDIRVIAFLKFRTPLLHSFDPQAKVQAFPSPRSWEFVSNLIKRHDRVDELLETMVRGSVGEGPGSEFNAFLRVFDKMPSIDAILLNPTKADVPTDPATLYAVSTALACQATKDNIGNIALYFDRVSDAGRPEFSVMAMKEMSIKDAALTRTRGFIQWASKHNHLIA